jgi:hypothetical protein
MTIKIAYRTEEDGLLDSTRHIAEGVTPTGEQFKYTTMVQHSVLAAHGVIVTQAAKRRAIYGLIDEAIHRGFL